MTRRYPANAKKVKQQLAAMETFFGGRNGPGAPCWCRSCNRERVHESGLPWLCTTMVTCPTCGNKRCPHATSHNLECTGSNEPGQAGSDYA